MNVAQLLSKKRHGGELTDAEISLLIQGYCDGRVADYQMSALAMAICLQGMTPREVATLTKAMLESGERLPRESSDRRGRPRVDKHSTGGLGDKISLVLAPLLAACDVDVPMISGRGLGLTGGTLDKLESAAGFRSDLTIQQMDAQLQQLGTFIAGASEKIAPADRRLYALRDVTGTVDSVALITASILSKKLAANLDALVMDVKVGSGAFMQRMDDAVELSQSLVRVGAGAGLPTSVLITDMDQPLGETLGNAMEFNEAVEVLSGEGPPAVRELTVELAANLLCQVNVTPDRDTAMDLLSRKLDDGSARQRFEEMIRAQGGSWTKPLKIAPEFSKIDAHCDGYISRFDCRVLGQCVVDIGGGRRQLGDTIDHSVGIRVHARVGQRVNKGDRLLTLHCHREPATDYSSALRGAIEIVDVPVECRPLIIQRIDSLSTTYR
ncbi:thymidine phosphorylase [Stieleria varia]|nr:thymidine phosphorylase [Stieleria varia]